MKPIYSSDILYRGTFAGGFAWKDTSNTAILCDDVLSVLFNIDKAEKIKVHLYLKNPRTKYTQKLYVGRIKYSFTPRWAWALTDDIICYLGDYADVLMQSYAGIRNDLFSKCASILDGIKGIKDNGELNKIWLEVEIVE